MTSPPLPGGEVFSPAKIVLKGRKFVTFLQGGKAFPPFIDDHDPESPGQLVLEVIRDGDDRTVEGVLKAKKGCL